MTEKFNTKERNKEFNKIYKQKILPFLEEEGFKEVTKTSKRVYKEFKNGLSVYIYFEFINFGSGFYQINIVYYDDELGKETDDGIYLAAANIKKPEMRGKNAIELNNSVELWLEEMKSNIISFIDQHSNHKAILNSNEFYFAKFIEDKCKQLLIRKSSE